MAELFEAIVIDIQQFYIDGYIYVKVKNYNIDKPNDLIDNYSADYFKPDNLVNSGCLKAKVFTPIGGGKNYGMFYLPQVNSKGIVSTLNGNMENLIWLGSFFDVTEKALDQTNTFKYTVNAPQDDINRDDENSDLITQGERLSSKMSDQAIILRTKSTDNKSVDGLDWGNRHTNNLIVIDNDRVEINRTTGGYNASGELDKYQKVFIGENDGKTITNIEYVDKIKNIESSFKIEEGNLIISTTKTVDGEKVVTNLVFGIYDNETIFSANINDEIKKIKTSIKIASESVVFSSEKDGESSYYLQDNKNIKLTTKEASVAIKEDSISLEAKKVRIASEMLFLGNGDQKLVTTDSQNSGGKLADGSILYFRDDKKVWKLKQKFLLKI